MHRRTHLEINLSLNTGTKNSCRFNYNLIYIAMIGMASTMLCSEGWLELFFLGNRRETGLTGGNSIVTDDRFNPDIFCLSFLHPESP